MSMRINESALLIQLENITESWIALDNEPDSFFEDFAVLLYEFKQIYHRSYSYFGYINAWCNLLKQHDIAGLTSNELIEYLQEQSFKEYQQYFIGYKSLHLKDLRRHRENESRNKRSLKAKVTKAIQCYSKSEVVRVDLSYLQKYHELVDMEDFCDDMEQLRKDISKRRKPFDDLVDYAWALEQGETKGYHCHLLLIFNGHKRQAAWGIAKRVGELWKEITGNLGMYFNCHDPEQLSKYTKLDILGVGRIHRENPEEVSRFLNAVTYLVRPEKEAQHLRIKPFYKMRSFQ